MVVVVEEVEEAEAAEAEEAVLLVVVVYDELLPVVVDAEPPLLLTLPPALDPDEKDFCDLVDPEAAELVLPLLLLP